jgi:dienelactone hydrolase
VINYYEPRGATKDVSYMLRVLSVTEFDAVSDAYNALKLLRTHPLIDASKIAITGYSYGGMAARFAMDDRIRQSLLGEQAGFAAHIDVYGPCFQKLNSPKLTGGPLLTLRGTEDNSNELPACEARESEIRATGTLVETHIYPGAGHAWDNHSERKLREDAPYVAGCTMEYDSEGNSSVNGEDIVKTAIDTSRHERIATRLLSSGPLGDCVGYGYVIGRDDKTRAEADAAVVGFLNKYLR